MRMTYGGHTSDSWNAKNGVRQGIFFNFYLNSILRTVSDLPIGCCLNGVKTNSLYYTDDIVIMAPSTSALQDMLDRLATLIDNLALKIVSYSLQRER